MQLVFYLSTFSTPCTDYLLYLMFRCDFDVMKNLWGSKHTLLILPDKTAASGDGWMGRTHPFQVLDDPFWQISIHDPDGSHLKK